MHYDILNHSEILFLSHEKPYKKLRRKFKSNPVFLDREGMEKTRSQRRLKCVDRPTIKNLGPERMDQASERIRQSR